MAAILLPPCFMPRSVSVWGYPTSPDNQELQPAPPSERIERDGGKLFHSNNSPESSFAKSHNIEAIIKRGQWGSRHHRLAPKVKKMMQEKFLEDLG